MGKKSRRDRPLAEERTPAARGLYPLVHGFDPTPMGTSTRGSLMDIEGQQVLMPPDIPAWKTHEAALSSLQKPFKEARFACEHEPSLVAANLQTLLADKGYTVVDLTSVIPTGPSGNHSVYPAVCSDIDAASKRKPKDVYLIVRTASNTPAYLGGTLYGMCANLGGIAIACQAATRRSTPAAMVICDGRHLMLPTVGVQGAVNVGARAMAAMVTLDPEMLTCVCCAGSLMRVEGSQVELDLFLATDCDHTFHPECLLEHFKTGDHGCPSCGANIPVQWVPKALKDQFRQVSGDRVEGEMGGNTVRGVELERMDDDERERDMVMNALAAEVRMAAIADGLTGVPEDAPSLSATPAKKSHRPV